MPEPLESQERPAPPEPEPAPPPPPPPPAEYARLEDFRRLEQTIAGQRELIETQGAMLQQALRAAQAPPPAPTQELSDEQLDAAVDEGRMTRSQAARVIAKRELAELKRTEIDPLRDTGLSAIGSTVKQLALTKMPHYERYKAEIDKWIESVPAQGRISPEVYIQAHNLVVGQHLNELIEEEREKAIRGANAPKPEVASPTTRSGRNTRTDQVPTVEEAFGREAARALEGKGMTPDQFAKRLGHADWATYVKLAQAQEAGAA